MALTRAGWSLGKVFSEIHYEDKLYCGEEYTQSNFNFRTGIQREGISKKFKNVRKITHFS